MSETSQLITLLRNNPDYAEKLKRAMEDVKQKKRTVLSAADKINAEHQAEIDSGTLKRQHLLEYGKQKGLSETATMQEYGKFLPTRQTPILNLLYFILKEDVSTAPAFNALRKEFFEQFGHEYDGLSEEELESKYGQEEHTESVSENVESPPEMMEYIYGDITLDQFNRIKKLKALSTSDNEQEAFLAYRACIKLCKQYNLEFDRIPCNLTSKK